MTGLVETVLARVNEACLVSGALKKSGCKISKAGAPEPRLIIDLDKPGSLCGSDQTRCDYLYFAESQTEHESDWIMPLELKSDRLDADEVVNQLQAGARAAEGLVPADVQVRFLPVAAAGGTPKGERNRLKSKDRKVRFHGCSEFVRVISCGAPLTKALGQ